MYITSSYLFANAIRMARGSNLLTDQDRDMSNWNIVGGLTIGCASFVNSISFTHTSGYLAPNGETYKHYHVWDVVWRPGFTAGCDIYSDYKIGSVSGGLAYCYDVTNDVLVILGNGDENKADRYIIQTQEHDYYMPRIGGMYNQTIVDMNYASAESVISDIPSFQTQNDLIDYLTMADSEEMYAYLIIPVVNGRTYKFEFDGRTTSGFNYSQGATRKDIELISGTNETSNYWINTTAAQNYEHHVMQITAMGSTLTIKFNFSEMISSGIISFDVTNMELYEV